MKRRIRTGLVLGVLLTCAAALADEPAKLVIHVKTNDQVGAGLIRVLGESGEEIGRGRSGETIRVRPGTYTVAVQNLDLVDKPERRRRNVAFVAGEEVRHTSEWPAAEVRLVTRVGRRSVRARVELFHAGGGDVLCQFQSGQVVRVSPGHYEAKVHRGGTVTTVTGLHFIFTRGAEQRIPVAVR